MPIRYAIFDMDGTVLNTLEDLTDSMNHVLAEMGYPTRRIGEIRSFVGNGLYKLCERACPAGTPEDTVKEAHRRLISYYGTHSAIKTAPYPGILTCLSALRKAGVKTAVVSNKADFAVQELAEKMFQGLFDEAVGEREGIPCKPAPDGVFLVMKKLGATPAETVYIGDSDVDLATARNAGLPVIAVTWGFRDADFLRANGATVLAATAEELTAHVLA